MVCLPGHRQRAAVGAFIVFVVGAVAIALVLHDRAGIFDPQGVD
jgi:hypothetical protein